MKIAVKVAVRVAIKVAVAATQSLALGKHPNADAQEDIRIALRIAGLDGKYVVLGCDRFVELPLLDRFQIEVEPGAFDRLAILGPDRRVGFESVRPCLFGHHDRNRFDGDCGQDRLQDLIAGNQSGHEVQANEFAAGTSFAGSWVVSISDQDRRMVTGFAQDTGDRWVDKFACEHSRFSGWSRISGGGIDWQLIGN